MSNESDGSGKTAKAQPAKPADPKPAETKPAQAATPAKKDEPLELEERRYSFEELKRAASQLSPEVLLAMLGDGRAHVRANAVLGLAASGEAVPQLVPVLRDSEAVAAGAAAEAIVKLGRGIRPLIPQIVAALDGTQPDITTKVIAALADQVGHADDELTLALDVPYDLAMKSIVPAAKQLGKPGVAFLIKAAKHERGRIRINAVGGLARIGKMDIDASMAFLTELEATDPVPDVRTAAKQASLAVIAREKQVVIDRLPKNIPDFEERKLSASELSEYDNVIDPAEMMFALQDGRAHVKINAARALAVKGDKAGRDAAAAMGLLMRDSVPAVRKEVAKSLAKLGEAALAAANDLIGALADQEVEVAEEAQNTLEGMGTAALDVLIKGLETGNEEGGRRVGELFAKVPNASHVLTEQFRSPAVNVQVNAALALGMLGKKVGAGLAALHGARTGGDARTRDAVRRALDVLEPRGDTGPKPLQVAGFESQFLAAADLDKAKAELEKAGVADLTGHLQDGRDVVRANAALGLGVIGAPAAAAALALGTLLRDDSARVRLSAAQALDKVGDAAVIEVADHLVSALGDTDEKVAEVVAGVLRARKGRMIGALVRGLESDKPNHGRRIAELINVFDDAVDILCDAFENPGVNVQVNAALGLGMLGAKRVGKGRKALEGARTGGWERTRIAVFAALEMLDGPKRSGPEPIKIDGFEIRVLEAAAFADPTKLSADDLIAYMQDGRSVVRANSATALGAIGPNAKAAALGLGVLMRDDDMRVRIAAAQALDKLGDDVVKETAPYLIGALRGDAEVSKTVAGVLGPRKAKLLTALLKGLETDDDTHARRILELVNALPDAVEILCDAIESPAENVQVNAAIGIGMLGAKRAGGQGRKALETRRTGGFVRTREAAFKGLALLKDLP
ncbi:MAG: HEAT repeat domain-containing protein [Deltaproteobacteria bacterium]